MRVFIAFGVFFIFVFFFCLFVFLFFFFFKQKTAYEILAWLEFRRVLFRSSLPPRPHSASGSLIGPGQGFVSVSVGSHADQMLPYVATGNPLPFTQPQAPVYYTGAGYYYYYPQQWCLGLRFHWLLFLEFILYWFCHWEIIFINHAVERNLLKIVV